MLKDETQLVQCPVKGCNRTLFKAVQDALKHCVTTKPINIDAPISEEQLKMLNRLFESKNFILKAEEGDATQKKFLLIGYIPFLKEAEDIMKDYTNQLESLSIIKYPNDWDSKYNKNGVSTILVAPGSPKYIAISQVFKSTLNKNIVKIERIQAMVLWSRYCLERENLAKKNNGDINEMMLFHGSRGGPAKILYESEEGFDLRFSNAGAWGKGNYFASNAQYSDSYAFANTEGKEMFYASVLIGNSITMRSTNTLTKPPINPQTQKPHDSVTNGSNIFISYTNYKAYPSYLITYN